LDRSREYAWHAHIPALDIEEVDKFMKSFDWNSLSEKFKKRNLVGKIRIYKKNSKFKIKI